MAKGVPAPPELRVYVTKKAIEALFDGVPVNVVALTYGLRGRTLHRWLQFNPQAFAARLAAIYSGRRFARDGLTEKQLTFRQGNAMRRLSLSKST